jgi:hypothetical protein
MAHMKITKWVHVTYLQSKALSTRPSTLLLENYVVQYTIRCKHGSVLNMVSEYIFMELADRHIMC